MNAVIDNMKRGYRRRTPRISQHFTRLVRLFMHPKTSPKNFLLGFRRNHLKRRDSRKENPLISFPLIWVGFPPIAPGFPLVSKIFPPAWKSLPAMDYT